MEPEAWRTLTEELLNPETDYYFNEARQPAEKTYRKDRKIPDRLRVIEIESDRD